jgi:hypothetical protein
MNFFTPKLMKIRWFFFFFVSLSPHLQIKLSTHGSNLNSIFVIMSELELLFLTGVLTQNFNTVDLVKFLQKKSKTSHLDRSGHIEGDIMQNQDFWATYPFLAPYPSALGQLQPYGCM